MIHFVNCLLLMVMIVLGPAALRVEADRLLSRNATYRIIGESYLYAGQTVPGTNTKVTNVSGYQSTPLVESTDTGDLLIDGDPQTNIFTDWYWNRGGKRITVEMTLPGPSTVNRVVVRLPENPGLRPQNIRLDVRSATENWQQIDLVTTGPKAALAPATTRKVSHTFELPGVDCQQIRVMCVDQAVINAQCGIAEIEVYGRGPVNSQRRGLIRSEPHLQGVTRAEPIRPATSRRLTRSGHTSVKLLAAPVISGNGSALVDRDTDTLVSVRNKRFESTQMIVELDVGSLYLIDAVNVWMSGGPGAQRGHINNFSLAISSSTHGSSDWQIPADLIVNPYWPGDDAPRPYVIPVGDFEIFGRRIRITANLTGQGGQTSHLALAEIEVWGRPARANQVAGRLDLQSIEIPPEPVGTLRSELHWMMHEKIRGGWMKGNLFDQFGDTAKTKGQVLADAGINLVAVLMTPDRHQRSVSREVEKKLPLNVELARELGIKYMVRWHFGSTHEEPYRRYQASDGGRAKRSCCPLDEAYFQRHVARWANAIVAGGADGMLIDTEMYESDQTRYPGPCVCDECFRTYLKRYSNHWELLDKQVAPSRRGLWLKVNQATDHYNKFAARRIERQFDKLRQRCQSSNPVFFFGHAPGLDYLPGIDRGLGTASVPCLIFSEREYTYGISRSSYESVRNIRQNIPALHLSGLFLLYHDPQSIAENALTSSLYCDGWWLYHMMHILNNVNVEQALLAERAKGTSGMGYFSQIGPMHQRLDKLLERDPSHWPRPDDVPEEFPLSISPRTP